MDLISQLVRSTCNNVACDRISLCLIVNALKGVCHKALQSIRVLSYLNLHYLVLEKSHPSSACLVLQISGSITGGTSHSYGKLETLFSHYHSYCL